MDIFYIGGSPCSGKSTIAEALSERYSLAYYKVDDRLETFTSRGAAAGRPVCQRILHMTADETWMRPPHLQCREELDYYAEITPFVTEELRQLPNQRILAEGAAFLPLLIQAQGIPLTRYIAIILSRDFQISRYRQRPWVPHLLRDYTDPEAAFANWMERDALFAEDIRRQCMQSGYSCLLTDDSISPEERLAQVAAYFRLD